MERLAKKVLLIGWDAADWKFLNPLLDAGKLPNLQKLIEGGMKGRIATLDPPLSPTLWTSIATGKRPYKHGIHGITEPTPDEKKIRPIFILNRKVKAIWNILTQHNLKTHVVGWWPSHPAEPINGVMLSNFFQRESKSMDAPWPLAKGAVHPESLRETFEELRVHPHELTAAHIQPFVPDAYKVNQSKSKKLTQLAKITAHCSSLHCATTHILDNYEWDFTAVYLDAIDHYCHSFMQYYPPKQPNVSLEDYELYKDVIDGACIYHDMMLGRLMEMAGEETTIMLVSDHGFYPDANRPKFIPREPIGPTIEHSPYGVLVVNGPNIKKDGLIFGASLLDITPTLLTLFGLPVAEDMDGKVLTQIFEKPPKIQSIQSWENIKGEDGTHPPDFEISEDESEEELKQLIELGYIEDPFKDMEGSVKSTKDENNFYLARAYIDGGLWQEAIEILEKLYEENPTVIRYSTRLAYAYQQVGKYKKARKVIDFIKKTFDRESPFIDVLDGTLLLAEQKYKKALAIFEKAEKESGAVPKLNLRIANAYIQLNELEKAENAIKRELKLDAEDASAWHLLGLINYQLKHYDEAVEAFLESIGLLYYYPASHFYLGKTLLAMEKYEDAAHAFDICLKLAPGINEARIQLIRIYEEFLNQPGRAYKYRTDFENNIKGEITIVSGLPRSGTSLMMQMLKAGGKDLFVDEERAADENNPRGYFEHEIVKSLPKNNNWLIDVDKKAIKVIAHLLKLLPKNFKYNILFMERNIYEVVQSQQKMLKRNGKRIDETVLPTNLVNSYQQSLKEAKKWADNQPNIKIMYLNHQEILKNPFLKSMEINDFLGGGLEAEKMAMQIDTSLYREKMTKL